jgi:spermidine synthase
MAGKMLIFIFMKGLYWRRRNDIMYHVISTLSIAILLYLISYSFYLIGYYSLQFHRRLWNGLLATAFLVTAFAGVFIALQINYKWNIPFIKSLLKWHVEFGIGLATTGIFHFIWHLNYYGKYFSRTVSIPSGAVLQKLSRQTIKYNLFLLGFVSSSVQFLLLREIMNITGGYELISGSFLGSWLIGSAIGASIAGKSELNDIRKINLVFAFSPFVSIVLMLFLSRVLLSVGETPSLLTSVIYTFIVLIPFCLVSGFTFTKLIIRAGNENIFMPGKSFSIETIGGIVAGLLVSVFSSGLLNTYKLLLLIILLSIGFVISTFYIVSRKSKIYFQLLVLLTGLLILFLNPDLLFRRILLPAIEVQSSIDTPYGNITKGKYKGEESLYYNQRLISYNYDTSEREEDIHYAMLQSDSPQKVIIISGSIKSHLPEILKYPVKSITYIERDPALARIEPSSREDSPGVLKIINKDAFRYIRNSSETADVIILLTPPPTTLLLNRYYTTEFFYEIKKKLNPDGVFMCSPGPGDNYFNKESVNLYSSIYNSLAANFKNVKPVGGNKLYLIASDRKLSVSFCELVARKNIKNIYVCSDYLEDDLIERKSAEINSIIDHDIKQNTSAFPIACLHSQAYQFSKTIGEKAPVIIVLFIIFALPLASVKRRNLLMYFCAAALAGFEIIILLILQLMIGNMYQLTGLIVAGLMAGLATGSGINIRFLGLFSLRTKMIFLMLFYLGYGLVYNFLTQIEGVLLSVLLLVFSGFLPAILTGHLFRELTFETDSSNLSPSIYSADLTGSAFGFIIISGFAIPLLGIQVSVFLSGIFILSGILLGKRNNN